MCGIVRVAAQQLDRDLAAEHGVHVRKPGQERRHFVRTQRQHQRADRVARDVGADVGQQARHRLGGPALALGELVHDAGHGALRVDADQRSRGVERDDRVLRGELLLERLPGAGIAQVAERADREDPPAHAAGMDEAARSDIEAEAERDRVQALRGLAAHGVVERVPLLHQVRQLARRRRRQRGGIVPFDARRARAAAARRRSRARARAPPTRGSAARPARRRAVPPRRGRRPRRCATPA